MKIKKLILIIKKLIKMKNIYFMELKKLSRLKFMLHTKVVILDFQRKVIMDMVVIFLKMLHNRIIIDK